jgi:hypothetical protein
VLALVGGALPTPSIAGASCRWPRWAAVAAAPAVNATLPHPHLWVLYVCSALLAAFTAVRRPPLDALIPRLVERDELKAASRCSSASTTWRRSPARRSAAAIAARA